MQTLRQLLPIEIFSSGKVTGIDWSIPCVEIEDYPRFKWRGLHLDVSRHFFDADFIKKYTRTPKRNATATMTTVTMSRMKA